MATEINVSYRTTAVLTPRLHRFLYTHYGRCSPSDNQPAGQVG